MQTSDTYIADSYEEYQEEIRLYECVDTHVNNMTLRAQDLITKTVGRSHSTHCHTTSGFIDQGNAFRFLFVPEAFLRNATTIGWYVHSDFAYSEINWTTYRPSLKNTIAKLELDGVLKCVARYTQDSPASARRFHKGYWLAATEQDTSTLLNRCTPTKSGSPGEWPGFDAIVGQNGGDLNAIPAAAAQNSARLSDFDVIARLRNGDANAVPGAGQIALQEVLEQTNGTGGVPLREDGCPDFDAIIRMKGGVPSPIPAASQIFAGLPNFDAIIRRRNANANAGGVDGQATPDAMGRFRFP
ncbi:hypothetical protein K432DRAFT_425980 [Lepidopterella palustris CBS 459.81]|uniref:Uncharacterized protein n=1 Tax=Lepidopterella palustris CBS 459.81 TaxID=1314670 RepID=A0A8E2E9X5_9PEZI|nr:hypothetical protein K432DRAFT_425980 [Lepidopterella palustris CBS 459.81]